MNNVLCLYMITIYNNLSFIPQVEKAHRIILLRLFSVKRILRRDKARPYTYAIFLGRKKFVIKAIDLSGGEG